MICSGCGIWEEYLRLKEENEALKEELQREREKNAQLEIENGKLRQKIALYETKVPSPRSKRRTVQKPSCEKRFPGRPKGYPGSTRPMPEPDLVIPPDWSNCENCGEPLPPPQVVRHHVVEQVPNPPPKVVIDYLEFGAVCNACGAYNSAVHEDCPPIGRFGKNVYVQTVLHKFEERLPLERMRSSFERSGLEISAPTELELLWRVSNWLRPEYERILATVRASKVVYLDQTVIEVDGVNFWIWDFVCGSEPATLFVIRNNKSQKVLDEVLGEDWHGAMVCDGLRSHHSYARRSGTKVQRDWAHLLTEAKGLSENYAKARAISDGLYKIFDRLKKALEDDPPPERRAKLARNAKLAMRRLWGKQYRKSKVQKFIEKIKRGYPYWFTFVTTPGVEPTNNRAERALRELVVQRKIIGTLRNQKGIRVYETLSTILATWKQRGLDLQDALSRALTEAWRREWKSMRISRSAA